MLASLLAASLLIAIKTLLLSLVLGSSHVDRRGPFQTMAARS